MTSKEDQKYYKIQEIEHQRRRVKLGIWYSKFVIGLITGNEGIPNKKVESFDELKKLIEWQLRDFENDDKKLLQKLEEIENPPKKKRTPKQKPKIETAQAENAKVPETVKVQPGTVPLAVV